MKLNKNQIQAVDNYLIRKDVKFANLKLEILLWKISQPPNPCEPFSIIERERRKSEVEVKPDPNKELAARN